MNAVVVIAIGNYPEWKAAKPSIVAYCKKYHLPLEVITTTKYGIEPFDKFSNSVNLFEKNQIYELFDKYDRILRLDFDLIISPNCPNLFDIVPEDKIGGVFEDVRIARESRRSMMKNIQVHLGDLLWESGYLNAGVIVASKQHRELFHTTLEEIEEVQTIEGITTPEQDYLNYVIRELGFEVYELSYRFNHIMHFPQDRFNSYIIHYAGSKVYDQDLILKYNKKKNNKLWRKLTSIQMKRDYKELIKR